MKIYIEFIRSMPTAKQKYHGGGNYSKKIVQLLRQEIDKNIEMVLICSKNSDMTAIYSEEQMKVFNITLLRVDKFSEKIEFEVGDILFSPILFEYDDFVTLYRIKKAQPWVKVYATVHDLRNIDYYFDISERYYFKGFARTFFFLLQPIKEGLIPRFYKPAIRRCLGIIDKVFTDSNNTMQQILRVNPNTKVTTYYIPTLINGTRAEYKAEISYALFVSGGRRLKNLIHALGGFSQFKKENPNNELYLYITGMNKSQFECICQYPLIDEDVIKRWVKIYEYVSERELEKLYAECKFLIYTSKREGFGLPLLEAGLYGKTAIASNVTSIPEVMGTAVYYTSPWKDEDITQAIAFFENDDNLNEYEQRVRRSIPLLKARMELDMNSFISDFFIG